MHNMLVMSKLTSTETEDSVLFLRGVPRDMSARLKAAAALSHKTMQDYIKDILADHLIHLERKGILPKLK